MKVKERTTFEVTKTIQLIIDDGQLKLCTSSIGEPLNRAEARQLGAACIRAASLIKAPRLRKPRIITGEGE